MKTINHIIAKICRSFFTPFPLERDRLFPHFRGGLGWGILVLPLAFLSFSSMAQTTVSNMQGTYTNGEYINPSQITISPGTTITPGNGQSVYIHILPDICVPLNAQLTTAQNFVATYTPRVQGITDPSSFAGMTNCQVMQTVQYIDGLGRPMQTVQVGGSPQAKDMVQAVEYDGFGREVKRYLPYADQSTNPAGSFRTGVYADQASFYSPNTSIPGVVRTIYPYAQTWQEFSPLSRPLQQGAPGSDWQPGNNHTVNADWGNNDATGLNTGTGRWARYFTATINSDGSGTLADQGAYPAGNLYVTVTRDENWTTGREGTTEEYKDRKGHVVLKRTFNFNQTTGQHEVLSTYYVYDDLGNLCFVLPPGAGADAGLPAQGTLDNLGYQYRYDERSRLVQKKLPGKGWEDMVYNSLDQVVMTQDAVQRGKATQEWIITKYDATGRQVMGAIYANNLTGGTAGNDYRTNMQTAVNNSTTLWETRSAAGTTGYTNNTVPNSGITAYLTVNYYDDYQNIPNLPAAYTAATTPMTNGLAVAGKTGVLNTADMLCGVNYYDDKGRNIQTYSQHYLGGTANTANYDMTTSTYSFTNELLTATRQHYNNGSLAVTIANAWAYDHMGRKLNTTEQINGQTLTTISQTDYNETGQSMTKHLGNNLQNVAYSYNERGWIIGSNSSMFSLGLNYNNPQYGATAKWNGNISEQTYNASISGSQHVNYAYDNLNRLISGNSSTGFSETGISYDMMGNIQGLNRSNYGSLSYSYNANQLTGVSGYTSRSYSYDANGNATSDGQGHGFTYNYLNLPATVSGLNLAYSYNAMGNKLRKVSNGTTTDYVNGIQYLNGNIDFIQTEEGRATNNAGTYKYEYTLTDHLGNNRVTFDQTNGKVGEDDYYPFGFNMHRQQNAGNKYLYNKKELQEELTQYDYGARFYDPVIARWGHIDPKAELYFNITPYAYAANTPVNAIDPDGKLVIFVAGQNTGGGGTHRYWDNPKTGKAFDWEVQWHFNDLKPARYYEGGGWNNTFVEGESSNLNLGNRVDAGHLDGSLDAESIIKSLSRTGGVITESIKVVAHSMGAAYAKGLITAIIEYAKAHPEECRGLSITEYDFAAYQQNHLSAIPGVPLYQFDNEGDGVVGGILGFLMGGSHHAKEKGREEKGSNDNVNPDGGHAIADFIKAVGTLQEGTYKFIDGKFVKQEDKK